MRKKMHKTVYLPIYAMFMQFSCINVQGHDLLKTIRLTVGCLLLALACVPARAQVAASKSSTPLARARQLILVTTSDWTTVRGTLQRFERNGAHGAWRRVGAAIPVVVGRNGLGWGDGLNAPTQGVDAASDTPSKREGDGRAPAGVFRLGKAFGFAPAREASWLRVPYTTLTPAVECVDDTASRRYNLIVDRDAVKAVDWNSSERMRSVEGYRWGLVVEHNTAPAPVPGHGSCIFLHIWAGPEKGTAGCTAMEQSNLEGLLRWLDQSKRPLLVQLPEGEYTRLRKTWQLPRLAGE
jgi:D-alanyl-D-alanine dipeptidase